MSDLTITNAGISVDKKTGGEVLSNNKKLNQIRKNAPNNFEAINKVKKVQNETLQALRTKGYNIGLFGELIELPKPRTRITGAPGPRH